jgi:hypothetical protein
MTLIIQKPTTSKLILAKDYVGIDDPDAAVYIAAVEAADEIASPGVGALETATKVAIHSFVKGCKNDGIWPAIKASCILCGARTRQGALVPLVNTSGVAPTFQGTAGGWSYNRKTVGASIIGLAGNGTDNYVDSNFSPTTLSPDSGHMSIHMASPFNTITDGGFMVGSQAAQLYLLWRNGSSFDIRVNTGSITRVSPASYTGFLGGSRTTGNAISARFDGTTTTAATGASVIITNQDFFIYCRNLGGTAGAFTNARLSFYSLGEGLNLDLLDARVTTLINAIQAAIP